MKGIPSVRKNLSKNRVSFTFVRKHVYCELRCILRDLKTFYKVFFFMEMKHGKFKPILGHLSDLMT